MCVGWRQWNNYTHCHIITPNTCQCTHARQPCLHSYSTLFCKWKDSKLINRICLAGSSRNWILLLILRSGSYFRSRNLLLILPFTKPVFSVSSRHRKLVTIFIKTFTYVMENFEINVQIMY